MPTFPLEWQSEIKALKSLGNGWRKDLEKVWSRFLLVSSVSKATRRSVGMPGSIRN